MDCRRTHGWCLAGRIALATSLTILPLAGIAADADRGRMLHDTHCISCHGTQVYKRDSKLGTNYEEVRRQVLRWETNASLKWGDSDIDAVATYLARTFYKVPCPTC